MKPISDVVIAEAIELAKSETKDAQTRMVASSIKDVMFKITNAHLKLARSKSEVEANTKSLEGLEGQLKKITEGDWSAIPEIKLEEKKEPAEK